VRGTPAGAGSTDRLLHGWGGTGRVAARVHRVQSVDDVVETLVGTGRRGAIARGSGRSYGDAAQRSGGDVLDMAGLDAVGCVDGARQTVRAQAGARLGEVLRVALARGFVPPVLPGTAAVSVGGALASDVHGKNHVVDGSFARHVERFDLVTADGRCRDVDASAPELFQATAGGMGLTGVVTEATLRLRRVPSTWVTVTTRRAGDLAGVLETLGAAASEHRYAVAWLDLAAGGDRYGRGIVEAGEHTELDELPALLRRAPLASRPSSALPVPAGWPGGAVNRPVIRAVGGLRWSRAGRSEPRLVPLHRFLFPLDRLDRWPRLYGTSGLVQYQFAVPDGAERTVQAVVGTLRERGQLCALAVLKRLGAQEGLLSFPLPGWTLALDLPAASAGLSAALDACDRLVAAAGGRVYLTKDARLRQGRLEAMYPELERWRAVQRRFDPGGRLVSDLSVRTGLLAPVRSGA